VEIGITFNGQLAKPVQGGRPVVADGFYKMPSVIDHLFNVLGRDSVFFVQLYCDLPELERREEARGNRKIGLARSQFEQMCSFQGYDLLIDSTSLSVKECVQKLIEEVPNQSLQGTQ
jgi:chloramphenicol 3-O phosphotransferase